MLHVVPKTLIVLLLLNLTVSSSVLADEASDQFDLAANLYKSQRWSLAAEAFREFAVKHPTHKNVPIAKLYLGITLSKLEQYGEARTIFRDYLQKYPNGSNLEDAVYRVARCSFLLKDYTAADKEYAAFIQKFPTHNYLQWVYTDYAESQLKLKRYEQAKTFFERSLTKYPNGPMAAESRYGLARAYDQLNDKTKAIELYTTVAGEKDSRRAPQAMMSLAAAHFDLKNYQKSAEAYQQFATAFPQSPKVAEAVLNAGFAWYQLGSFDKAITEFEQAARDQRLTMIATYWKGMSLKSQRNYDSARDLFQATQTQTPANNMADRYLYQWGDCELRLQRYTQARDLFLKILESYPESRFRDDALLYLGETQLRLKEFEAAQQTITTFARDYPQSPLFTHHQLQQGRLLVELGGEKNLTSALRTFQDVLAKTQLPTTLQEARFQVARVQQKLGQHAEALKTIDPLVKSVQETGQKSNAAEALALQAASFLVTKDYTSASQTGKQYLSWRPKGTLADQALATVSLAEMQLGNKDEVMKYLGLMNTEFPASPLLAQTMHQIAELAYGKKDWQWAGQLFTALVNLGKDSPYHAGGLSGQAWCYFQLEQYTQAASVFSQVVQEYPNNEKFTPEAAYKAGHSWQEANDLQKAVTAYETAFVKYAPETPAPARAEEEGTNYYAYRAGLQTARMYRQLKKIDESDKAYEQVVTKYPNIQHLDKLLDEWALLNYEAGRYARSDEIFARLVKEVPKSDLADDAQLSLAESLLADGKLPEAQQKLTTLQASAQSDDQVKELSLFHLVGIGVETRDWKSVHTFADKLLAQFPQSEFLWDARFYLAEAGLNLDQIDDAKQLLSALVAQQSREEVAGADWFPRVFILLAEIGYRQKEYSEVEKAVADFRNWDAKSPLLYQADEILGRSYKNQAEFDKARQAFERVIKSPTGRRTETAAKSQFMLAETHLIQKDFKTALLEYLKVNFQYKFPEWQAPALYQAARCHEALKEWKEAVQTYEQLIKDFPQSKYAADAKTNLPAAQSKVGT